MLKTRTRTVILSIITFLILFVFVVLFVVILKNPSLSESSVSSIFIINIITIMLIFLLLLILVIKSVIRLIYQRRRNILGSRLNSKIVFTMLLLVLLPTVPTYFIIGPVINNIFNVWNQKRIGDAVDSSIGISRSYLQNEEKYFQKSVEKFSEKTRLSTRVKLHSAEEEKNLISQITEEGYSEFFLFDLNQKEVIRFPKESAKRIPEDELAMLFEEKGDLPRTEVILETGRIEIYYPLYYKNSFRGLIIAAREIDPLVINQIKMIEEMARDYKSLIKFGQRSYSFIINLSFLAVGFVLLFLTFWIAFYIAKQITIPVEALLAGTEKVAQGDLDVHIDLETTDELGILIDSFNKMVMDIRDLNVRNEEHTKFISSILQNINTGVIALTPEKKVIEINESAKNLLKLPGENTYRDLKSLLPDSDNYHLINSLLEESLKNKRDFYNEEINLTLKGKAYNFHMGVTTGIESLQGGFLVVFDDITHIIHIQKIEAWRDVATQLAHEIKNPLTPIKLSAQRVLKKYQENADDFEEILTRSYSTIIQEVDNIKALVDHFNSFARLPEPKLQELNLNKIVNEVVDLYRN
ncbi:MAG TPA: HAMP domain-containing protein, partial [Firmicutes bacterium]|nr:HAMP domain-containing protein [Bacillota bacterium]